MLSVRKLSVCTAIFLALFCAVPSMARDQAEERLSTVTGVVGEAKVRFSPNFQKVRRERAIVAGTTGRVSGSITDEWTDLRLNMVIGEYCEIKTSAQSEVRLETAEGSVIRIGENSHVEVAMMRAVRRRPGSHGGQTAVTGTVTSKFRILAGSVVANIKKLANENTDVRFETPTSTAAIRGTVIEIDVGRDGATTVRAFEGTVHVASVKSKRFVELKDGNMAVVGSPKQKAVFVRPVPKNYKRRTVFLPGEDPTGGAPADSGSASAKTPVDKASDTAVVKLTLDLGGLQDTINCYARDTLIIEGRVAPASAKVSVNGIEAAPDADGVFKLFFPAPPDSGLLTLAIAAQNDTLTETVIRTVNVAHVYTDVKLLTPTEGLVVTTPVLPVSGTAEPGSKINVLGKTINAKRDGTFSAEIPLPDKQGDIKVQIEIVDRENNAVWIERNVKYKK